MFFTNYLLFKPRASKYIFIVLTMAEVNKKLWISIVPVFIITNVPKGIRAFRVSCPISLVAALTKNFTRIYSKTIIPFSWKEFIALIYYKMIGLKKEPVSFDCIM